MNPPGFAYVTLNELRRTLRMPWVWIAVIALCGATWVAVRLGERDFREQQRAYAEQLQTRLQVQLRFPTRVTGRGPEPGLRVLRPPSVFAMLVQGQDRTLPAAWEMTPAGPETLAAYSSVGRRLEGGGTWDLEVLVRVFGGFIALALGLSGSLSDRLSGWGGVLASSPIGSSQSSLARLIGTSLALSALVLLWWSILIVCLLLGQTDPPVSLGPVFALLPCVVAYVWTYGGVGAACAWRSAGAFEAVFFGVTFWFVTAVLGPALMGLAAEAMWPLPAPAHFEQVRREQYADDLRATDQAITTRAAASIPQTLSTFEQEQLVDHELRGLDGDWQAEMLHARASAIELETQWQTQQQSRRRFQSALAWLSPGSLLREALTELAGTGAGYANAWTNAVADYQFALDRSLFDNRPAATLRVFVGKKDFVHTQYRHPAPQFADLPQFADPGQPWRARLQVARLSLIGLFVWLVVACTAAWLHGTRTGRRQSRLGI